MILPVQRHLVRPKLSVYPSYESKTSRNQNKNPCKGYKSPTLTIPLNEIIKHRIIYITYLNAISVMGPVSEFAFLRLKPDVKPEDPENEGGRKFLEIMSGVKKSPGFQGSSWGRTVEDENDVVWAIG
jgi:hypothetical protein